MTGILGTALFLELNVDFSFPAGAPNFETILDLYVKDLEDFQII